ncbi:SDR family NAD(P)-dependent oxidoreductase [uncultured Arthrobacter sp.]|uniref:SDR family NAD(P)-dependent oxidoreductase n=1 Tax=uncultured Arthrobacter sp. TaxID=114050 RepID=UPI0025DA45AB|nr:SDR family NAD(P)-dependent oxidoreductase [uncultured Arthrobacter sp.]
MSRDNKVWLISGAERSFGRIWAAAALERGDRVVAAVRDPSRLADLVEAYGEAVMVIKLDGTDQSAARLAVKQAAEHFGRLDVVVTNAGYGQFGALEEVTEQEFRTLFETNIFGAIWLTQAVIPVLRAQGSGHILLVGSIASLTGYPNTGAYHASNFALEGLAGSLAPEVLSFGIKVTVVDPGTLDSDSLEGTAQPASRLPLYDMVRTALPDGGGNERPEATGPAILALVDTRTPPLRVLLDGPRSHIVKAMDPQMRARLWSLGRPLHPGQSDERLARLGSLGRRLH